MKKVCRAVRLALGLVICIIEHEPPTSVSCRPLGKRIDGNDFQKASFTQCAQVIVCPHQGVLTTGRQMNTALRGKPVNTGIQRLCTDYQVIKAAAECRARTRDHD